MSVRNLAVVMAALMLSACPLMAAPLKVLFVSGSFEYESDVSLKTFGEYLDEAGYDIEHRTISAPSFEELPGVENLEWCDVALFFTRRLTIEGEQLEAVKRYCLSGKPIVAVRTASHGFQNWLEMDKLILGGAYDGHHGGGPTQQAMIRPEALGHPIMEGVLPFASVGSLYKQGELADNVDVLMTGEIPEASHPIAWTREYEGARIFYTSLGHQEDFSNESFRRMLANALFWVTDREPAD